MKMITKILFYLGPVLIIAALVLMVSDYHYRLPFFPVYLTIYFLILLALWAGGVWLLKLFFAFPLPRGFYLRTAAAWSIAAILGWLLSHWVLNAFLAGQGGGARLYAFTLVITWVMGLAMIFTWHAGLALVQRILQPGQFPMLKTLFFMAAGVFVAVSFAALSVSSIIRRRFQPQIYSVESVPAQSVAVVFGAGVYEESERPSLVLRDRLETAARLYEAGKVTQLLLSGDGSSESVEVDVMARYAASLGVPEEALVLDREGYRTRATCTRAADAFGFQDGILVTQAFHLPRALFLCESSGLQAVGVAADQAPYSPFSQISWAIRETAARTVAWLEVVLENGSK
ncbi:YdcF family protein [bacterium]|nr:YdcF family protein [bacterium]